MKKIFGLLTLILSCIMSNMLVGMESAQPRPETVTPEQNIAMFEYACQQYPNYGINELTPLFVHCETEFPNHAQLAKLYVYLQTTCHERYVQEDLLLKTFDIAHLFASYPKLLLKDKQICWLYDTLQQLSSISEKKRRKLFSILVNEDHIPFLEYARAYVVAHNLQIRNPQFRFGPDHEQWREKREAAYNELPTLIHARSTTATRTWLEYHQLNPNRILEGSITPLSIATIRGSIPMIAMLLAHGAKPQQSVPHTTLVVHNDDMLPKISYEEWFNAQFSAWGKAKEAEWARTQISEDERIKMRIEKETELFHIWDDQQAVEHWHQEETETSALCIARNILSAHNELPEDVQQDYRDILDLFKKQAGSLRQPTHSPSMASSLDPAAQLTSPRRNALAHADSRRLILGSVRSNAHLPKNTVITRAPVVDASCSCHPITCDIM